MADKIYPQGIVAFQPNENAPKFVKGTIIITPEQLVKWLRGDGKESLTESKYGKQLKLQLTKYQGKLSLSVDNWKPTTNLETNNQRQPKKQDTDLVEDPFQDIPF